MVSDFAAENCVYLEIRTTPRATEHMTTSEYARVSGALVGWWCWCYCCRCTCGDGIRVGGMFLCLGELVSDGLFSVVGTLRPCCGA